MKVLYRDEFEKLAVMEVTKASFDEDESLLNLNGPEDDIAVRVTEKQAEAVVKALYEAGQADVTAYPYAEYDFADFDDDDDDDDDDFDAMLDRLLDDAENEEIIRFR